MISDVEMINSIWEDVCRSGTNTMPFCVRDISILTFWCVWVKDVLEPVPHECQEAII